MADCVINHAVDVFRGVIFHTDDGGSKHADSVRLEKPDKRMCVHFPQLLVLAALTFQPHPDIADSQSDQLFQRVRF